MVKTALEKQIEKQMKQQKQLAEKQLREEKRRLREQTKMERKQLLKDRASSIVNGCQIIDGFRIMDKTAEQVLDCLFDNRKDDNTVVFDDSIFPSNLHGVIDLELEKLIQYGMIGGLISCFGGWKLNILPPAITYFSDKEQAMERKRIKDELDKKSIINYGNLIVGNVTDSILTVDNSISEIKNNIEEFGGEDKEVLLELLEEVEELIMNINQSRSIPTQKKLYQKLSDHMSKHGWFYGEVVQLLGTAALKLISGT